MSGGHVSEVTDEEMEQAFHYWYDLGFDEGYQVGYEEGLIDASDSAESESSIDN